MSMQIIRLLLHPIVHTHDTTRALCLGMGRENMVFVGIYICLHWRKEE